MEHRNNKKILVIDDYPTNVLLLTKILQKSNYEVVSTTKSKDVCKLVEKESPSMILLDIMMPKLDGIELLQILKNEQRSKEIPVVIVSAKTDNGVIEKAMELGAVDYIKKPISIHHLIKVVNRALQEKELN